MKLSTSEYFIKEVYTSFKRNIWMTLASIFTVVLSLFILGFFSIVILNLNKMADTLESQVQISVYLKDDLSQEEKEIFQYRFDSSDSFFSGHAIGNLVIAALNEMHGNIFEAVQILSKMMHVDGHVFPASNEPLTLNAEFVDGSIQAGETEITALDKRIKRVWVTDTDSDEEPRAVLPVLAAIMQADAVVLGPGSLFTSILPNLMISNLGQAVRETKAEVIYICNIMTQQGETDHFSDADHVRVINEHLGGRYINTALVNGAKIDMSKFHPEDYDAYLEPVRNDFAGLRAQECRVITDDFIDQRHGLVFHDGKKVGKEIINLAFEAMSRRRMDEN